MSIPSTPRNLPASPAVFPDSSSSVPAHVAAWLGEALAHWSRRRADTPDTAIDEAADLLAVPCSAQAFDNALIALAKRVAGPGVRDVQVVRPSPGKPRAELAENGTMVEIPLRFDGKDHGLIRLTFEGPHHFSPERYRRLTTLGILGGAVDVRSGTDSPSAVSRRPQDLAITHDATTGLPNASFLTAYLNYALALAGRRHEPISLLCIGIDRLTAIRALHGPGLADEVVRKVARTIAGTLRSSDLIARLDDGRLMAVLPGASHEDSREVAETVRLAISAAGVATPRMPIITAAIGVASYPDHAADAVSLRAMAAAALADARSKGHNRVAAAPEPSVEETVVLHLVEA